MTTHARRNFEPPATHKRVASGSKFGGMVSTMSVAGGFGWLLAVAGFVVGGTIIADNSLLTHLATGSLIVDHGRVPDVDPYSLDFAGRSWTVQSWLASLIYARAVDMGGDHLLRLIHGLLASWVMVGVWRLTEPARELITRAGLSIVPLLIGGALWSPRPFMFGLVGLVVVLLVMNGSVRSWALLPTMYLWVNTHGSFPLALVLIGAAGAGWALDQRSLPVRHLRLAGWTVAGILLAGVNPVGPRLWWFPVMLLGRGEALDGVVEWAPPAFDRPVDFVYLALLVAVIAAARRGLGWEHLLPATAFLVAGLMAIRNMAPASIVVVAMVAPALSGVVGRSVGDEAGRAARMLTTAGLTGLVVSIVAVLGGEGLSFDRYPVDAVSYLEARDLTAADDVVVIHREGVGNYLTYRYGESAGVFIDDRFDFYPVERTRDHLVLVHGGDYGAVLDRHQAQIVIWERESALTDWLDGRPDWDLAYRDDEWVVACRATGSVVAACDD